MAWEKTKTGVVRKERERSVEEETLKVSCQLLHNGRTTAKPQFPGEKYSFVNKSYPEKVVHGLNND